VPRQKCSGSHYHPGINDRESHTPRYKWPVSWGIWHPWAKYPREIGTPKQNTLREFGTPLCTPWRIWHPITVQLNVCQQIKARHCWTYSDFIRMYLMENVFNEAYVRY